MDEPLSNLDAKLRGDTRAELVELHRRLDSTFIYVTHDQVEAMTMGSRVAVLNGGRLEQVGTPQDVYDKPASAFVAQFIGTPPMNLLQPGQLGSSDVQVGIRPEHLLIAADGALEGTVRQIEHLGHEVLLLTESPAGRLTARVAPHADLPVVGDTVRFDVADRHLHRFDAVTGVRVP
jgi:multiple sugar transport system ATP-binding protein